jgi:hypothetical protein
LKIKKSVKKLKRDFYAALSDCTSIYFDCLLFFGEISLFLCYNAVSNKTIYGRLTARENSGSFESESPLAHFLGEGLRVRDAIEQ